MGAPMPRKKLRLLTSAATNHRLTSAATKLNDMKLDFRKERVLAVVAHPDDAELLCAGTLARTWEGGRTEERKLKRRHNSPKLCPLCAGHQK